MNEFTIREATEADDAPLGELLLRAFTTKYAKKLPGIVNGPERIAELRDGASRRAAGTVLVAEEGGRAVGTIALVPFGATGSEAWIPGSVGLRLLAIDTRLQGRGLSKALLDEAERRARAGGATAACLHVRREAEGVARLYTARGYRREPAADLDFLPQVFLEAYVLRFRGDPPSASEPGERTASNGGGSPL